MLEDYVISDSIQYSSHGLVYDTVRVEGALGAALLSALLVGTEEGNRRGIAIATDEERYRWIKRYEQEVLRDDWGLLLKELDLLRNAYVELAVEELSLTEICPNNRLFDLAMRLFDGYMRHLVQEEFCEHIWEVYAWEKPFATWLFNASQIETRRQRFLHMDWTDMPTVIDLADRLQWNQPEPHTLVFENEAAEDIMKRYLRWRWTTYQAQLRELPGAQPRAPKHRNHVVNEEIDWYLFNDLSNELPADLQPLWTQWMYDWQTFITRHLKPQKPVRFWTDEVSGKQQTQLIKFLRVQEKQWDHYKCLSASIYALRQLGYVRRVCSVPDITRWMAENLAVDYTEKNRHDQFLKAWKELGRYTEDVKHFVSLFESHGIRSLTH